MLAALVCCGALSLGQTKAEAQPTPSIRGVVVGAEYTQYIPAYSVPLGINTKWWFGFRPDIPQSPGGDALHPSLVAGDQVPAVYGRNGKDDGGFPNVDDWPLHITHPLYSQTLPATDAAGRNTVYLSAFANRPSGNVGPLQWPGIYGPVGAFNSVANAFADGDVINGNSQNWGGFFGKLRGSNGSMELNGAPWSSSGADFFNGVDGNAAFFLPGPPTENFYIYDLTGSVRQPVGGKLVYDLEHILDATHPNGYAGRIAIVRKAYAAPGVYGYGLGFLPAGTKSPKNTFIIQGIWQLKTIEGTFNTVFSAADAGKALGTWGQPNRFWPEINYNDFNFQWIHSGDANSKHNEFKSMVYQFVTASVKVTRKYCVCDDIYTLTVTNDGDVDLYNLAVTDTLIPANYVDADSVNHNNPAGSDVITLRAGKTMTYTVISPATNPSASSAAVESKKIRIERNSEFPNLSYQNADGTYGTLADLATTASDIKAVAVTTNALTLDCQTSSIRVHVACDENDSPVNGLTTVMISGGTLAGPTPAVAAGNGDYVLEGLTPATYTVEVTAPAGYVPAGTQSQNVQVDLPTGPGQCEKVVNFNLCTSGKICVSAVCDENGIYIPAGAAQPMGGVNVTLYSGNDTTGPVVDVKPTATDGGYCFVGLTPGTYTVAAESLSAGKVLIDGSPQTFTIGPGGEENAEPFIYKGGVISGRLYCEVNGVAGYQAGIDEPKAGVDVVLSNGDHAISQADGTYRFLGCLVEGNYTVSAPTSVGGNPIVTPLSGTTPSFHLDAGGDSPNHDFIYDCGTPPQCDGGKICVELKCKDEHKPKCDKPDCSGGYRCTHGTKCTYDSKCDKGSKCTLTLCSYKDRCSKGSKCEHGHKCSYSSKCSKEKCSRGNSCRDTRCNKCHSSSCGSTKCHDKYCDDCHDSSCNDCHDDNCNKCHKGRSCTKHHSNECGKCHSSSCNKCHDTSCKKCHDSKCGKCHKGKSCTKHHKGEKCDDCSSGSKCDTSFKDVWVTLKKTGSADVKKKTDVNGKICFENLVDGTYTVTVDTSCLKVSLDGDKTRTVKVENCGTVNVLYLFKCCQVKGCLFNDRNCNNDRDDDEDCYKDVHICLKDKWGRTVKCTKSDRDGNYCFEHVKDGDYTVCAPKYSGNRSCRNACPKPVNCSGGSKRTKQHFCYR